MTALTNNTAPAGAPNLDAMTVDELHHFASQTKGLRPRTAAYHMFGTSGDGMTQAIRKLNCYAWNRITAMACRERGDIDTALMYDGICERIYADLPPAARW